MTFKPAVWFPIASALCLINLGAVAFAEGPYHSTGHAVLAVAFALWAQRLRRGGAATQAQAESLEDGRDEDRRLPAGFEMLENEMSRLRQELSETQERLDFAERMLQRPDPHRGGNPPHQG